jgi:hypothetical protein
VKTVFWRRKDPYSWNQENALQMAARLLFWIQGEDWEKTDERLMDGVGEAESDAFGQMICNLPPPAWKR